MRRKYDVRTLFDNSLATWGFTTLTVVGAINGLWLAACGCAVITGFGWTARWRRAKQERHQSKNQI